MFSFLEDDGNGSTPENIIRDTWQVIKKKRKKKNKQTNKQTLPIYMTYAGIIFVKISLYFFYGIFGSKQYFDLNIIAKVICF